MPPNLPCPGARELQRLVLGLVAGPAAEALEEHLVRCEACAELVQRLRAEDAVVGALPARVPLVGEGERELVQRLMDELKAMCPAPRPNADTPPAGPATEAEGGPTGGEFLEPPRAAGEIGRVGPVAVLRVLGTGGMGVVYQARQAMTRRLVALKVLLVDARGEGDRLARFRGEIEIVARLRHPHIVPIHEAGESRGRPYFTMEYVEGGSLAQKLAAAPLPPRPAAALVRDLARAVQYAHEQGFVHRDLKPSNVLLTAAGEPKISDFGLAKRLGELAGEAGPGGRTETGTVLGTPGYMAPEQAGGPGGPVGPAADVYALGAILYECLTGRPPFKGATPLETLEQLRSREPVPPGRLQPGLPRDLQTVCLKCLEKDPRRRYAAAQELADDLGRFLDGRPVRARPAGPLVRLAKWARRKPTAAALVLVCGLSLSGLFAGILVHNARLEQARTRAEAGEEEARRQHETAMRHYRAARHTLIQMLKRLEGRRQADPAAFGKLRQDQLEDALAFYQEALRQADNPDPAMRLDTAQAYRQAASIQFRLVRPGPAAANFRKAVALIDGLPPEYRDRPEALDCLADCYTRLAGLTGDGGRLEEAEQYYLKTLALRERLARGNPDDPRSQHGLATAEHHLGVVYLLRRRFDRAEAHYARAIALGRKLVDAHPDEADYRRTLGGSYLNLGMMVAGLPGRRAEAAAAFAKAEVLLRPLARNQRDEPDHALTLAGVYVNWGNLVRDTGRPAEALRLLDQAVELADTVSREVPQDVRARDRAYQAHGARAQVYERLDRFTDAVRDWDRVIELARAADRPRCRLGRAIALARGGEHARAAAEAGELARAAGVSDDLLYASACVYAQAVGPARADARLGAAEKESLAERYAQEALALLTRLYAAGYFRRPDAADALRTDNDLAPLRSRPEFRKLLSETAGTKQG